MTGRPIECCLTCRFSQRLDADDFAMGLLRCRRYAPQAQPSGLLYWWPAVKDDFWCGDWQLKRE